MDPSDTDGETFARAECHVVSSVSRDRPWWGVVYVRFGLVGDSAWSETGVGHLVYVPPRAVFVWVSQAQRSGTHGIAISRVMYSIVS